MASGFEERELFGGAMVANIPVGFLDVRYVGGFFFWFCLICDGGFFLGVRGVYGRCW